MQKPQHLILKLLRENLDVLKEVLSNAPPLSTRPQFKGFTGRFSSQVQMLVESNCCMEKGRARRLRRVATAQD